MGYKYPADQWVTRFMTRRRRQRILAESATEHRQGNSDGVGENDKV
jgi:hypothetical protein